MSFRRDSLLLMAATVAIGIGNYGFSLAVIWLLSPTDFSEVASVSSVLLVIGSVSSASIPWMLARGIGRTKPDSVEREQVIGFALMLSLGCGFIAMLLVLGLSSRYANSGAQIAAGATAFALFLASVAIGYLQGLGRFVALAIFGVAEVLVKFGSGIALALTPLRATGAIMGGALGTIALSVYAVLVIHGNVRRPTARFVHTLGSDAARIGGVQLGVSMIVTLDIVVGSGLHGRTPALAGYQAMAMFTRLPLFAAVAISMVAFPRLSAAADGDGALGRIIGEVMGLYLAIACGGVAIVATLPAGVVGAVLPHRYAASMYLLTPLAIAGFSAGLINLTTTFFQSVGRFKTVLQVLVVGVLLATGAYVMASKVTDLAWAAAAVLSITALVLVVCTQKSLGAQVVGRLLGALPVIAAGWYVLHLLEHHIVLWSVAAFLVGYLALYRTRVSSDRSRCSQASALGPEAKALSSGAAKKRRELRWLSIRTLNTLRPLAPPSSWRFLLSARSLASSGPVIASPSAERVLVLAPHPDDETIGCGGTMAMLSHHGARVTVVCVTDGEASVDGAVRAREVARQRRAGAIAACERLGADGPVFLSLPDSSVETQRENLTERLAEQIRRFRPQIVMSPWLLDGHPDHQAVAAALADVPLDEDVELWNYEVWTSLTPNRVVDITDWWEDKCGALSCHGSYAPDHNAVLSLSRWRSLHGLDGHGYAEAFLALNPVQYRQLFSAMAT